jgi:hypothetical protein
MVFPIPAAPRRPEVPVASQNFVFWFGLVKSPKMRLRNAHCMDDVGKNDTLW